MNSVHNVSDASLYTDFSGLTKLRAKAADQSDEATKAEASKEVAKQFESLFLQMMLKSMRDATAAGQSSESDQTQFYQEMFDKQIALDLSNNGDGIGIAKMLQQQLSGKPQAAGGDATESNPVALIRQQIERTSASIQPSTLQQRSSGQE